MLAAATKPPGSTGTVGGRVVLCATVRTGEKHRGRFRSREDRVAPPESAAVVAPPRATAKEQRKPKEQRNCAERPAGSGSPNRLGTTGWTDILGLRRWELKVGCDCVLEERDSTIAVRWCNTQLDPSDGIGPQPRDANGVFIGHVGGDALRFEKRLGDVRRGRICVGGYVDELHLPDAA